MTLVEAAIGLVSSGGFGAITAWFTARQRAQIAERRADASEAIAETRHAGEQLKHDAHVTPLLLERLKAVEDGRAADRAECAEEITTKVAAARAESGESVRILAEEIKAMLRAQAEVARKVEAVAPEKPYDRHAVRARRKLTELDEPTGVHRMEELVERAKSVSSQSIPAVPGVPSEDP